MVQVLERPRGFLPPMQRTTINWSHPLARGLKFFPVFGGGMPFCVVNHCAPTAIGTGLKIGPQGGSFAAGTSNNGWFEWSQSWVGSAFSSKTEVTIAILFKAFGTNNQGSYISLANSSNTAYTILGNAGTPGWWPNSGSNINITTAVSPFQVGSTYLWVGTGNAAGCRATIWANSGIVGDSGTTAALGTLNASLSRIRIGDERGASTGAAATGSFSPLGEVFYAAAWDRSVTLSEMADLARNPYAFTLHDGIPVSDFSSLPFIGWGIPF